MGPIINQGGPLPMLSPANTYTCLTQAGPGCDASEPDKYYPSGARNYFRLTEHDVYQAVALAQLIRSEKRKRLFILHDHEAYGYGVAVDTRAAARRLGLRVVGFGGWNLGGDNRALMQRVRASGADALLLAGLIDERGDRVIRDKVAVLGPTRPRQPCLPLRLRRIHHPADDRLDRRGGVRDARHRQRATDPTDAGARAVLRCQLARPYRRPGRPIRRLRAAAAETMLAAIARSDGTRESVIDKLRRLRISTSLGTVSFRPNGDPNFSTGFTAYRMGPSGLSEFRTVRARMPVVRAISR